MSVTCVSLCLHCCVCTYNQVMLTLGMLAAVLVNLALSTAAGGAAWRWMVGLPAIPGEFRQQQQQGSDVCRHKSQRCGCAVNGSHVLSASTAATPAVREATCCHDLQFGTAVANLFCVLPCLPCLCHVFCCCCSWCCCFRCFPHCVPRVAA